MIRTLKNDHTIFILFLGVFSTGLSVYRAADVGIFLLAILISVLGFFKSTKLEKFLALIFIFICFLCFSSGYIFESYSNTSAAVRALIYFSIFPGLVLFFKYVDVNFHFYSVKFLSLYLFILSVLIATNYANSDLLQMYNVSYYIGNMYLPEVVRLLIVVAIVYRLQAPICIPMLLVCIFFSGSTQTAVIYTLLLYFRLFHVGKANNKFVYISLIIVVLYPFVLSFSEPLITSNHNFYVRMVGIKNAVSLSVNGNLITPFIGHLSFPELYLFDGDYRNFNHEFMDKQELIGMHNTFIQILFFFTVFGLSSFMIFMCYTLRSKGDGSSNMNSIRPFFLLTLAISLSANTSVFSLRYVIATALLAGLAASASFTVTNFGKVRG